MFLNRSMRFIIGVALLLIVGSTLGGAQQAPFEDVTINRDLSVGRFLAIGVSLADLAERDFGIRSGVMLGSGSNLLALAGHLELRQLPAPSGLRAQAQQTGNGRLAAGNYRYQVTATNANGETTGAEIEVSVSSPNNAVNIGWQAVFGAAGYRVYRDGALLTELSAEQTSFQDTGTLSPNASRRPPTLNTTGGNLRLVGQLQVGRFAEAPAALGLGALYFNTQDNTLYFWNGSEWVSGKGVPGEPGRPGPAGKDADPAEVAARLAADPRFQALVGTTLAEDAAFRQTVAGAVAQNPALQQAVISALAQNSALQQALVNALAGNSALQNAVVNNPQLQNAVANTLAKNPQLQNALAQNGALQQAVGGQVAQQIVNNQDVRNVVIQNILGDVNFQKMVIQNVAQDAGLRQAVQNALARDQDFQKALRDLLKNDAAFRGAIVAALAGDAAFQGAVAAAMAADPKVFNAVVNGAVAAIVANPTLPGQIAGLLATDVRFVLGIAGSLSSDGTFQSGVASNLAGNPAFQAGVARALLADTNFLRAIAGSLSSDGTCQSGVASNLAGNGAFQAGVARALLADTNFRNGVINAVAQQVGQQLDQRYVLKAGDTVTGSLTVQGKLAAGNATVAALAAQQDVSVGGKLTVNGNVGIGTTNPAAKLHIANGELWVEGSGFAPIRLKSSGAGKDQRIWTMEIDAVDRNLKFRAVNDAITSVLSEPLVLTRSGNVGIGTTSPQSKLDVAGTIRVSNTTIKCREPGSPTGLCVDADGIESFDSDIYLWPFQGNGTVWVNGNLEVSGFKGFFQDHPSDPTKQIVYAALEGPEAGTYLRGTAELANGEAVIELPEHFSLVTTEQGLTVQLTPLGEWLQLYVVEKSPRRLVIREAQGKSGRFDYLVQGVRKGFENHQVIQEKQEP